MQVVFDQVFLMKARCRAGGFRPEIRNLIRATQLQADEMIDLVLAGQVTCYTVLRVYLVFLTLRHVSYRACISLLANDVFGRVCEEGTRCAGEVLEAIVSHTSRGLGLDAPVGFPAGWISRWACCA